MKKIIYLIFVAILVLLIIGFAGFNSGQIVSVKFIGLRMENEFWVFVVASLLIGMVLGYMFAISGAVKQSIQVRKLNKQLKKSEKEVSNLRNLPAKENAS